MPEGTSVGNVYLDLVLRDRLEEDIQKKAQKASQQAQATFRQVGKNAANAMESSFSGGYNKTLEKARSKVQDLERQFDSLGSKMDSMRNSAKGMFKGLKNPGRAADQFLGNDQAFNALVAKQEAIGQKLSQAQENLRIETEAAAAKAAAAQENAAKRAAAAQVKAQEKAAAAATAAQAKAARESEKKWRNATKGIRGLFRTVGGALKATFLTAGLYAFFKGMKSLMSGAVGQSKEFSAALAGVKSNLTTAFAPILTAVLPMLTALMNGLATATRAIATFIASIFGQTYAQAQAAGKKLSKVASSAGGAAKAAQKANATLGIDELNVVDQQDDSGGGGGGASSEIANTGKEMTGLLKPLEAFWARFKELLAPSITAWQDAWTQIKNKAIEVWPQIQNAALGFWNNGLKPLGSYLLTDFAPSVINAFSQAFAPITGDVISAGIQIFTDFFVWTCSIWTDAIQSVVIPALDLFKTIWQDMMAGIESAWSTYGKPICDGVVEAFNGILTIVQSLWDTVVKPFLQYCIEKGTELWEQTLQPLWNNYVGMIADIMQFLLTLWNNVLAPLINWIVQTFGPFFEKIFENIANIVKRVVQNIGDSINNAITIFRDLLQFFTTVFQGDWEGAWQAIQNIVVHVWEGIKNSIRNTVNGIIDIVNGMISGVCEGINAVLRAVSSVAGKLGIDISPQVSAPQIPHLAQGGYVGPNQPQLAMIGDNRREGEIVAPESKLAQAVAEGMNGAGGEEQRSLLRQIIALLQAILDKDESITIGDDVIGRAASRWQSRRGVRLGGETFADAY